MSQTCVSCFISDVTLKYEEIPMIKRFLSSTVSLQRVTSQPLARRGLALTCTALAAIVLAVLSPSVLQARLAAGSSTAASRLFDIDVNPCLFAYELDVNEPDGNVWSGSLSISTPTDSGDHFVQVYFPPPFDDSNEADFTVSITAVSGGISPSTLQTEYTGGGGWVSDSSSHPGNVEMAFIVKRPTGGWPMGGILLTITLTYE
jgi:hypothetical protein